MARTQSSKPKAPLVGGRKMGRVLITGASAGIGAELARVFAKHGHKLALVARSEDKLKALAAELKSEFGTDAIVISADLSSAKGVSGLVAALDKRKEEIDILVNNAGVLEVGAFCDTPTQEIMTLVNLNVAALTQLTSLLLPRMVERKFGRVLNVASLAAFQPLPTMAAYAASKSYVLFLTEALSEELRGTGVKISALCPGLTDTSMVAGIKARSASAASLPSMLISDPKDVARQGYAAVMAGRVIQVPGIPNQVSAAWSQITPRWLSRTLTGFAARRTDWAKRV
jgi:short-subunit dehydrogenase